ncbi:MAG: NUDIX domain-containing protein [Candidatus Magasanikbacteria bacterium]|nr:NUDIX domain-containing protein [Candidatus Magasanikbacteria bacterium]
MKKILIATTNKAKFEEITIELADLHFKFVSLTDLKLNGVEVDEPHATTWENALEKAQFFAKKTGLLTVAEDTGLFIDYLNGEPGVKAKRLGATAIERNNAVLKKLEGVPDKKRAAYFETSGCLYNPTTNSFTIFKGRTDGIIAKKMLPHVQENMGYASIFYYPPMKKLFAEMPLLEKNIVSQRGKMAIQLKYFLMKNYQPYQLICAAGIIVKDGKMLMTKRRDFRPEFNDKWEFPGGGVEGGETFVQTLHNEVLEETGFKVQIRQQMPDIVTTLVKEDAYQVHLFMCVCTIKSGKLKLAPSESSDYSWFTYTEALKADMLPLNKKLIQSKSNKKVLLKYIKP